MSKQIKKTFCCIEEANDQVKNNAKEFNMSESKFITTVINILSKMEYSNYRVEIKPINHKEDFIVSRSFGIVYVKISLL